MGAPLGNHNNANGKRFRLALEKAIAERSEGPDKWNALVEVATKLIDEAKEGNITAIREVADRLDGKAAQQLMMTGDGGGPIAVQFVVKGG